MTNQDMYWLWMLNIPGITRNRIRKMLSVYRSPEQLYYAAYDDLEHFFKNEQQRQRFLEWRNMDKTYALYEKMQKSNIGFVHYQSEHFPGKLKQIPDSPLGLYYKGKLPDENKKTIAIIGARNCTRYGKEMAQYFGRELAKQGVQIVSGLARGIDGCAHRGALQGNGYTIGVLGGGIDQVYPKENFELFLSMEQHGGIVSENNMGIKPYAALFPERNRLISGFCDGILVVEAMEKSGTFITVDQGLDQGKDIFSVPGRILDEKSAGCNRLIKLGAHIVTDVTDILDMYFSREEIPHFINPAYYKETMIQKMSLAPTEKMVYSCLQIEPKYLDEIIAEVNLAPQDICRILNRLILLNMIEEVSCNYYGLKIG